MKLDMAQRLRDSSLVWVETGCWVWQRAFANGGYGKICVRENGVKRNRGAHVVSYEHHVGLVPDGMELDHVCRNRACINPMHLEPVTRFENARRRVEAHRSLGLISSSTHCKHGHPWTPESTYVNAKGHRFCKPCRAASQARSQGRRNSAA